MTTDTAETNVTLRPDEVNLTHLFRLMPAEYSRELGNLLYSYGLTFHCIPQTAGSKDKSHKTVTCETCNNFSTTWVLGDNSMTRDGEFKPKYIQPLINALRQHGEEMHPY